MKLLWKSKAKSFEVVFLVFLLFWCCGVFGVVWCFLVFLTMVF